MNKIIFITPYFGNTGSEIALFNLIVRIKDLNVVVISRKKGSLAARLPKRIPFYDYESFYKRNKIGIWLFKLRSKIFRTHASIMDYFLQSVIGSENALVYVNTLVQPGVIYFLKRNGFRFVLHCHEMQQKLATLDLNDVQNIVNGADFIFTSSNACKDVISTLGRKKDIAVSYPGIEIKKIKGQSPVMEVRKKLNIPHGAVVVTMSGTIDSNKNPEAFLEIGKQLKDKGFSIHLLWIGVNKDSGYYQYLKGKAGAYGMEMNCSWVYKLDGETYYDYLNISDCFVLTSRYESFSIVLVEALALGKPVFSFQSGGPQEIVNDTEIGILIDNHSVPEMVNAIEGLILGKVSFNADKAKIRASDFSADEIFQEWYALITARYFSK